MSENSDQRVHSGITRRSALKKLGTGAAIAWTAPVLMSAGTKAFAASSNPSCFASSCEPAAGGNCTGSHPCGTGCTTGSATANNGCYGVTDTEGNCFCAQGVCGCQAGCIGAACSSSSECGPGQHCVVQTGCCGAVGHCYDCCGLNCH